MMQWSISSAVLTAAVIGLRYLLRGRISLRMQYALWLLVLVRLLVPVSFGASDLSVMNAMPERTPVVQQSVVVPTDTVKKITDTQDVSPVPAENASEPVPSDLVRNTTVTATAPTVRETDWAQAAKTVWLIGAAVVGAAFLASNLRFGRRLRRSRKRVEDTGAGLPVYVSGAADTPCLFGLFRPAIYLTPGALADAETLRYALAHERTHYRHGDHLWAVLRGVCLALHWYDPLAWWAVELSRRDAELACDEATVRRLGESERAAYGRTLVRMTCEKRPALFVTATMMTDSGGRLRERITLLVKKPKTAAYTAVAVLLAAGLAAVCTFTGGRTELADPFGREYEVAEAVGYAPICSDRGMIRDIETLTAYARTADGVRELTLRKGSTEGENRYETVTAAKLTKQNFDARFESAVEGDGPTEWRDAGLSASKLRRENANAWLCTSSTAEENGWADRVYLLQQKDGTLYLVMAEELEASEVYPDGRNFVCWVLRLTEKAEPTYASMEEYVLSVINTLKQPGGYTYSVAGEDGLPVEVTEAAADMRVAGLEKLGDCMDLAPDGVLELWYFSYEVKPEDKADALPDRFFWVGGNSISDDGYIFDGFYYYLTVLRTDDDPSVYKLLNSQRANDGLWYNGCGYKNSAAYLHDFYVDYAGLDLPRMVIPDLLSGTVADGYGYEDCVESQFISGDGWYLYVPTVAWMKTDGEDSWGSLYYTYSALRVDKSVDSVEMMEQCYLDGGFTLEQYREGAALCGPWRRFDADSGTQFEMYLVPNTEEGGCYIISTYWTPTDDDSVNEWGYSRKKQIEKEAVVLRAMAQSFTVAPELKNHYEPSFDEDIALASNGGAAWLYFIENDEYTGGFDAGVAWNTPALNSYNYVLCEAPKETGNKITLWLSNNDSSYFEFYKGTNVVGYFVSGENEGSYYMADSDLSLVDGDGRTLYDHILMWYDEAEFVTLRNEVEETPIPNRGQSLEEAAQEYLDAYENVHLQVRSGSQFKFTWVKNLVEPAEDMMEMKRERGDLEENKYYFYSTTEFIPETQLALNSAMAGDTGGCDDPDAPEGAYAYGRCCTITLEEDGWHGKVWGTGW